MNSYGNDIALAIYAIEDYLIQTESALIERNAGDDDWDTLLPMRRALENFKLLGSIYGK